MMPDGLRAVDCVTINKQLIDVKSLNLSLKRMKSYSMVKIMSTVARPLSGLELFTLPSYIMFITLNINIQYELYVPCLLYTSRCV